MQHGMDDLAFNVNMNVFESDDLREAKRFFEWALSYERKGLKIAADALRDEGRKSFDRHLSRNTAL
ncbi:hypothetical protein [Vampirovibrio sp.]|uniref:hypothetical protein n=1 Tax=Vampirovibrio sp. TaxID=2717857 RepID=UPI003593AE06